MKQHNTITDLALISQVGGCIVLFLLPKNLKKKITSPEVKRLSPPSIDAFDRRGRFVRIGAQRREGERDMHVYKKARHL